MSTFAKFLDVLARRSEKTRIAYGSAIGLWARTTGKSPDEALEAARSSPYGSLDEWANYLCKGKLAPKSILLYFNIFETGFCS